MDKCKKHDVSLECLAGHSAHPDNWYCPECDKEDGAEKTMSEPDLSTQMKRHLWLAEKPGVNKLISGAGVIVGYSSDEALHTYTDALDSDAELSCHDWKSYIEPPKPKWYEVAKPGTLFAVKGFSGVFVSLEYDNGAIFDGDGAKFDVENTSPIPSSEIQRYLDLAIELEKQGVS